MHIIDSLEFGGAEKVLVDLANNMADSHEIAICCVRKLGELASEVDKKIKVFCLNKGRGNDYRLPFQLARLIRAERFDVVHTHHWGIFLEGALAGFLSRAPVLVHTVHGSYIVYPHGLASRLKVAIRHVLERLLARRFTRIVAVSDSIQAYIERDIGIPARHMITIHNGIRSESVLSAGENRKGGEVVFVTVGRLAAVKNQNMMIRAFAGLLAYHADAALWIIGDGPERKNLAALVDQLALNGKVQFLGYRTDVDKILGDSDIFLMSSRYEGISIAILEAMRAKLPVVATRVGGVPETVIDGDTGLLVESDDVNAMVAAMRKLVASRELRRAMGLSGNRLLDREFSIRTMVENYQRLYASVH